MFPAAVLYALADLLVPELSRARATERRLRIVDLTDKCLRLCILFACGVAGFLFVCGDALGQDIYHSADAGRYLKIFAPMVLMLYLDAIVDGMLKGLAEQVSCVRYNTLTNAMDVVFLFLLLPRYGIGAYIFTFLVTHLVNLCLSLRRLLLVSKYRLPWSELWKSLSGLPIAGTLCTILPAGYVRGCGFLLLLLCWSILWDALQPQDRLWLKGLLS